MNQITDAVKHIIIINAIVFVGVYGSAAIGSEGVSEYLSSLLAMYFPLSDSFRPFQLITHMFMHADVSHLFFNMLGLYFLGPMVERYLGIKRFLILYFVSGALALMMHQAYNYYEYYSILNSIGIDQVNMVAQEGADVLRNNQNYRNEQLASLNYVFNIPMVGASGALFGVVAAFGALFPNARLMLLFPPIPIKGKYLAIVALAGGVLMDFNGNVAHLAHLGGAIAGFALIYYWKRGLVK